MDIDAYIFKCLERIFYYFGGLNFAQATKLLKKFMLINPTYLKS